jgi:hypothetical protein
MRTGRLIVGAALSFVGACTIPLSREGRLPPLAGHLTYATYTLAAVPGDNGDIATDAAAQVREALAARGYRETAEGRYRLEVGLAIAPPQVEVQRPEQKDERMEGAVHPIVLCRPQRYVLTVGMIDRTDGSMLFRNAAAARYCGPPAKVLPHLVRTAVSG